jgi:hypothetical protein
MKTSKLLHLAKPYLWDGTSPSHFWQRSFLCYAIQDAAEAVETDRAAWACIQVRKRIRDDLGGMNTAEDWLVRKRHATRAQTNNMKNMQAYRHRWLAALIDEYAAKGD